jgi:hypothetical protein
MSVSAAKSRVMQAKMQLESNRVGDAEAAVEAGLKFLEGLPDSETAAVRAELMQIRAGIASRPKPEDARNLSAAQGKVRQAQSQIAGKQLSGIEDVLLAAEGFLKAVPDALKAAVVAEIAAIRAGLSKPQPVAAPAGKTAALTDDDYANLSRAKSRVQQAKSLLETRRTENIEAILEEAMGFISKLPAAAGAPLAAEVTAIRGQTGGAVLAEDTRRITEELERHLRTVESNLTLDFRAARASRDHVESRLKDEDVKRILTPAAFNDLKARAADLRVRLAAAVKADALNRASPILTELEARVATDPFAGRAQREAYEATSALETLKNRVRKPLLVVPDGDREVAAIEARLAQVDAKINAASLAWGKAELDAQVVNSWSFVETAIAGWDKETVAKDARPLDSPELPKTRLAIQRIRYLLADPATEKIRAENKGDGAIEETYRNAEQIFATAAANLNSAFASVLDAAEKLETPLSRFDLDRPGFLAHDAEQALGGTRYAEPAAKRARALDARWQSEVQAIVKSRQELCDKLIAEANAAWPAISAAANAVAFDPQNAKPGTVVRLDAVYNRCGWDYSGRAYDFAMLEGGTVVAGAFDPQVRKAIDHACYELKVEVSDRITWDVIAVVEGPGKIGERTKVILRDKFTNFELGQLEEWPLIDCVKLRVVALHAGPVAVGR